MLELSPLSDWVCAKVQGLSATGWPRYGVSAVLELSPLSDWVCAKVPDLSATGWPRYRVDANVGAQPPERLGLCKGVRFIGHGVGAQSLSDSVSLLKNKRYACPFLSWLQSQLVCDVVGVFVATAREVHQDGLILGKLRGFAHCPGNGVGAFQCGDNPFNLRQGHKGI